MALVDFVSTHGHSRTPRGYRTAQGFDLGMWVANQRRAYRESTLGADQIERLELLPGWVWEPHSQRWDEMFRAVATHLDTDQEITADGFRLGDWVHRQALEINSGRIPLGRYQQLVALRRTCESPTETGESA